jgi:hypothetical protein
MDRTLRRLLDALPDSATADPLDAFEALRQELLRLKGLSEAAFEMKMATIRADVADLEEQAELAAEQARRAERTHEQALQLARLLDDLGRFAEGRTPPSPQPAKQEHANGRRRSKPSTKTTRDRVLDVMRQHADLGWTPQLVYDELRRLGESDTRTSVQTALQRLHSSPDRLVQRIAPGTYRLAEPGRDAGENLEGQRTPALRLVLADDGDVSLEDWLTDEVLDRVANEAVSCFLDQHPGEGDSVLLAAEAKRRVNGWTERHQQEPYDEAHVRRLMKTALSDLHRRAHGRRSRVDSREVTA